MKLYAVLIGLTVLPFLLWGQMAADAEPEDRALATITFYVH